MRTKRRPKRPSKPPKATRWELEYIKDMERVSSFDLLDRGEAEIVEPKDYPEPLKRLMNRPLEYIRLQMPPAAQRKLFRRAEAAGVTVNDLIRRWIREGLKRDAG